MGAFSIDLQFSISDNANNIPTAELEKDLSGKKTFLDIAETVRRFQIDTSLRALKEEQAKGFDKNPRQRIDNKFDAPLENLRFFGKVEYFAKQDVTEALLQIYKELEARSPWRTGLYRKGNTVIYNTTVVGDTYGQLVRFFSGIDKQGGFKEGDRIIFVNTRPYARKLELLGVRRATTGQNRGLNTPSNPRKTKSKKTGRLLKKPNGAYYLTYRLARRKFKSIANSISFSFISGNNSFFRITPQDGFRTTFSSRQGKGRGGRPYLYPTIQIQISEKGIIPGGVSNVLQ